MATSIPASFDLQAIFLASCELDRQRTAKGYDTDHDVNHVDGELGQAAACYSLVDSHVTGETEEWAADLALELWPWDDSEFNPSSDPIDNARKAAGLALAELARLIRRAAVMDQFLQ